MSTTTVAVIVENTLPAEFVAIEPQTLALALELSARATALVPASVADLDAANTLFREVDALNKAITTQRLELTRPIDALKDKVIAAERQATLPLIAAKEALGKRMLACKAELDRVAAIERKKAEDEARRKAEVERARLEAERQVLIAKQKAEHDAAVKAAEEARAVAEAKAKEEAELFGVPAEAVPEVMAPAAYIEPPPVVVVAEVLPAVVAPVQKMAVRQRVTFTLDIFDPALLISAACAEKGKLYGRSILVIDEKAAKALLDAGCAVPGARLVEVTGVASSAARGRA